MVWAKLFLKSNLCITIERKKYVSMSNRFQS